MHLNQGLRVTVVPEQQAPYVLHYRVVSACDFRPRNVTLQTKQTFGTIPTVPAIVTDISQLFAGAVRANLKTFNTLIPHVNSTR